MNNPMDRFQFQQTPAQSPNILNAYNQARQNPRAFEDQIRKTNPQAYQRALQLRNSVANPQEVVLQMLQQRGINPNIINMINL
jgi:predicted Zn-dependent peptidase